MLKQHSFSLGKGITFFSSCKVEGRKFNRFEVYFLIKRTARNMILSKMLTDLFDFNPVSYEENLRDILREMYYMSLKVDCNVCEDKIFIKISLEVLNDKYVLNPNENLCQKAIEILCDVFMKADIQDRGVYYHILKDIKMEIECDEDEKENYLKRAFASLFTNTAAAVNSVNSLCELDDVSYNIYSRFYTEVLKTARIAIFGYGEYDEISVCKQLKERFKQLGKRTPVFFSSNFRFEYSTNIDVIAEAKDNLSSSISVFYFLGNPKCFKFHTALCYLYAIILHDILIEIIREEHGLVYGISVTPYMKFSYLVIHGKINKNNLDEIMSYIKSPEILKLKVYDEKTLKKKLDLAKRSLELSLRECYMGNSFNYLIYICQDKLSAAQIHAITLEDIKAFAEHVNSVGSNLALTYFEKQSNS